MPIAKYQLPDGRIARFQVPDGTTPEQAQQIGVDFFAGQQQSNTKSLPARAQSASPEEQSRLESEFTADLWRQLDALDGVDRSRPFEPKEKKERTFGETAEGVAETALALGTGITTGMVGMGGGFIEGLIEEVKAGKFGSTEAADRIEKLMVQRMGEFTNTPESEAGKGFLKATGEFLEPLGSLPPVLPGGAQVAALTRPSLSQAATQASRVRIANPFTRSSPTIEKVAELVEANADPVQLKSFAPKADPAAAVTGVSEKAAKAAKKQGVDAGLVDVIRNSSKADIAAYRESLAILKANKRQTVEGKTGAITNRPGDPTGNLLFRRFKAVEGINKRAGQEVARAANNLKGTKVSLEGPYARYLDALEALGVTFSEKKGRVRGNYSATEFARSKGTQQALDDFVNRAKNSNIDGLEAHRLKKVIDGSVEHGKRTTKDPILAKGEGLLKDLRRDINKTLAQTSKAYERANKKFSDTRTALDEFEGITGAKFDPSKPNQGKMLVSQARSMMSNNVNRTPTINAINSLQEAGKKYGAKFPDDILKQAVWMDEMETLFGSSAPMSFGGQIEKSVGNVVDQTIRASTSGGIAGVAGEIAISGKNLARGINEENLIKSLDELLQGAKKK